MSKIPAKKSPTLKMKNQALFLKYRPQTFDDIVGQESVVRTLRNSLKANKPVHAYLFAGSRGTGKTSLARLLAKGLNCENLQDGSPCGKCKICTDIAEGNLVDVIEIDAASNRGIDDIRELREKVNFTPNFAKRKVYIIDEVHMLTKDASNALLKTLEEPPEHAYFILATTELHKILDTIISRCQTFIFGRFTIEQLVNRLQKICDAENFVAEKTALELIARKAEGGLRDAISALDQIASESGGKITEEIVRESLGISSSEMLENFWQAIAEQDAEKGFEVLRTVSRNGADLRTFGHDFLGFLREKMFQSIQGRISSSRPAGEILAKLIPTIEEIETALVRLKTSPITELPLEIAVVKLCSPTPLTTSLSGGTQKEHSHKISRDSTSTSNPSRPNTSQTMAGSQSQNSAKKQEIANEDDFIFDDEDENPAKNEKQDNFPLDKGGEGDFPKKTEPKANEDDFIFDDEDENPAKNTSKSPLLAGEGEGEVEKNSTTPKIQTSGDLTAQKIREKMTEIAQKSGIPVFVKRSFLTTSPQVQGNVVTFCAHSSFHYEQIANEKIRGILEKAVSEIFGQDLIVKCSRGPASNSQKTDQIATSDDLEF